MVDVTPEGIGARDFTLESAISGTASVSGNIITISGEIAVSGCVANIGDYIYRSQNIVVTANSGGIALGSGLVTSGRIVHSVTVKNPEVKVSGTNNYGFVYNSGSTAPLIYIGGYSGDAPYPGGGFICSGKGLAIAPGESKTFYVKQIDHIYAAAMISGNPLSYIIEMR